MHLCEVQLSLHILCIFRYLHKTGIPTFFLVLNLYNQINLIVQCSVPVRFRNTLLPAVARWLVASFLPLRPEFDPRSSHVRFFVGKTALGQIFF